MFGFFVHFQAVVDAQYQNKKFFFDFICFYGQKTNMADMVKLGYGCING